MIELKSERFHVVTPLFQNIQHNTALVFSVLEGSHPGRVFVDDAEQPGLALLYPQGTFYYLGGSHIEEKHLLELERLIFDQVVPAMEERELVLFIFVDSVRENLYNQLKQRGVIQITRKIFTFHRTLYQAHCGWKKKIPAGFSVSPMEGRSDNQFGFQIMKGTEIISTCQSVVIGKGEAEIDITTDEKYQGKGFATLAACAFIDECLKRGLTPAWSCWPFREASLALAKKLGFEEQPDATAIFWAENM